MGKLNFVLLIILTSRIGLACEAPKKTSILIGDFNSIHSQVVEHFSQCQDFNIESIHSTVKKIKSRLPSKQKISLSQGQRELDVLTFNYLLTKYFDIDETHQVDNSKLISSKKNFISSNIRLIDVECDKCTDPGEHNLKAVIQLDKQHKQIWIKSLTTVKTAGLSPTKDLPSFQPLNQLDLIRDHSFYTSKPNDYIKDKNSIQYYKTNKPLTRNKPIKKSDLSSKKLIKNGDKVKILYQNGAIFVKALGTSLEHGYLEQIINVKSSTGDKVISGKIVDYGVIKVEL